MAPARAERTGLKSRSKFNTSSSSCFFRRARHLSTFVMWPFLPRSRATRTTRMQRPHSKSRHVPRQVDTRGQVFNKSLRQRGGENERQTARCDQTVSNVPHLRDQGCRAAWRGTVDQVGRLTGQRSGGAGTGRAENGPGVGIRQTDARTCVPVEGSLLPCQATGFLSFVAK